MGSLELPVFSKIRKKRDIRGEVKFKPLIYNVNVSGHKIRTYKRINWCRREKEKREALNLLSIINEW